MAFFLRLFWCFRFVFLASFTFDFLVAWEVEVFVGE